MRGSRAGIAVENHEPLRFVGGKRHARPRAGRRAGVRRGVDPQIFAAKVDVRFRNIGMRVAEAVTLGLFERFAGRVDQHGDERRQEQPRMDSTRHLATIARKVVEPDDDQQDG
ncbi:hypothetical protein D3C72_1762820 [compost metagenome]